MRRKGLERAGVGERKGGRERNRKSEDDGEREQSQDKNQAAKED